MYKYDFLAYILYYLLASSKFNSFVNTILHNKSSKK